MTGYVINLDHALFDELVKALEPGFGGARPLLKYGDSLVDRLSFFRAIVESKDSTIESRLAQAVGGSGDR